MCQNEVEVAPRNLMHVHLSRSQVVKSLFVHSDIFFKHKHMVHVA